MSLSVANNNRTYGNRPAVSFGNAETSVASIAAGKVVIFTSEHASRFSGNNLKGSTARIKDVFSSGKARVVKTTRPLWMSALGLLKKGEQLIKAKTPDGRTAAYSSLGLEVV